MKSFLLTFFLFAIFPLNLSAEEANPEFFDQLPIASSEVSKVTQLFWNAQSIQDNVKQSLPQNVRNRFVPGANGCDVKSVIKTEGSADACELTDDPERMAKFIYNFSISCNFGSYQVSVCSREENKLMNQLKVSNPERMVSDDDILDWDSKI